MREEFWNYYVEFGHSYHYLQRYYISSRRIGSIYSGILLLASAGGIATLSCWAKYPTIWALITAAAQVLQALKPLMQSSKQRESLKFIMQDAGAIFDELAEYWERIDTIDPGTDISAEIRSYKQRFSQVQDRFAGDIDFPEKKRLINLAKKDNAIYFWYHYGVKIEEEYYAEAK